MDGMDCKWKENTESAPLKLKFCSFDTFTRYLETINLSFLVVFCQRIFYRFVAGRKSIPVPLVAGLPLPTASQVNSLHESVCLRLH